MNASWLSIRNPRAGFFEGQVLTSKDVAGRIAKGIALVPEDRKREGLIQIMSIRENLTLSAIGRLAKSIHLSPAVEIKKAADFIKRLMIKVANPENPASSLSGGQSAKSGDWESADDRNQSAVDGRAFPRDRYRRKGRNWLLILLELRTYVALIFVFVCFSFMAPNFLAIDNAVLISKHVAINAFLAIGMTYVIITGGIDLSVGSVVGLTGMVAGYLLLNGIDPGYGWSIQFNTFEIIVIVCLVGIFVGWINGVLVTKLNVAPFIATLGTLYVARGAALLLSNGRTFPNLNGNPDDDSGNFPLIGAGNFLGLPVTIWMLIAVTIVAIYISWRTPLGRHIYATGGNERGAALSGVRIYRIKMFVYMFSGMMAAIVGIIIASQLKAAHPATGEFFELNAIAAAVLGGTSMAGGRRCIWGTIVGAFVIGFLADGLIMMGVSSFWQMVIKGLVIIAAVVIDQFQSRLQTQIALSQEAADVA